MSECKAKDKFRYIQTNLGTFRHNQTCPGIIQAYSGIFRTVCYPDIFYNCGISRTLTYSEREVYSEPCYIQNPAIFRTLHIQNLRHIQKLVAHLRWSVNYFQGYNYFHKLSLFSESLSRWNKYLEGVSPEVTILCKKLLAREGQREVVSPEVVILCKKNYCTRGTRGLWIFDILIDLFK